MIEILLNSYSCSQGFRNAAHHHVDSRIFCCTTKRDSLDFSLDDDHARQWLRCWLSNSAPLACRRLLRPVGKRQANKQSNKQTSKQTQHYARPRNRANNQAPQCKQANMQARTRTSKQAIKLSKQDSSKQTMQASKQTSKQGRK